MSFLAFAKSHGLIVENIVDGRWIRCPTEDHPRKRNGSYKYMGDHGFVQNFATMQDVAIWKSGAPLNRTDAERFNRAASDTSNDIARLRTDAAKKAGWILKNTVMEQHAYLDSKGFPEAKGLVWRTQDDVNLLVIPMRVGDAIVGCQLIDVDGNKRFLKGQQTAGASFIIDNKGIDVWCEGFATAMSVRATMAAMKERYRIHVCFSASNMVKLATGQTGVVIADHDRPNPQTGKRAGHEAALAIGLPYWISEVEGEDFNDFARPLSLYETTKSLQRVLRSRR